MLAPSAEEYSVGAISSFLQQHGEELSDQEKELESSSEEEEDEEYELKMQLALRDHLSNGTSSDWMAKYASPSDDEEEDDADEQDPNAHRDNNKNAEAERQRKAERNDAENKSKGAQQKKAEQQKKSEAEADKAEQEDKGDADDSDDEVAAEDAKEEQAPAKKKPRKQAKPKTEHVAASSSVYVGNLPFETAEADLESVFAQVGKVSKVVIHRTSKGRSKGFGYVEFPNAEEAAAAVETLNDKKEVGGRMLKVSAFDGVVAKRHIAVKQLNRRKQQRERKKRKDKAKKQADPSSVKKGENANNLKQVSAKKVDVQASSNGTTLKKAKKGSKRKASEAAETNSK